MVDSASDVVVNLSIILPANNEARLIGGCLDAVLASNWDRAGVVQVIVVANGCTDDTADKAQRYSKEFARRGWVLRVLDLEEGSKLNALNAGDAVVAETDMRLYLDADVTIGSDLLQQIATVLDRDEPCYASGSVKITAQGFVSRAYARFWQKVPFMAYVVPGCGVFAVNAAGRARWAKFPNIISDDIFVRLNFAPQERHGVKADYQWPIAEGFARLVRVRRRQDAGVAEIDKRFPELAHNDDKPPFPLHQKLAVALREPIGFLVYSAVAATVKVTRGQSSGWSRGR